ncbi:MAG: NAD-dependent epimerase/dehydratase family protein [Deltaproteobacteria bacterium]|nr:NAD-dependent epimerase/dehydratase family protein [Deltaproteobacteria bacterium]
MKIGIVGCGLNSDYHINFAKSYAGAEIVGVVDKDKKKAAECASRHNISGVFTDIKELIASAHPDVIHILTPLKSHFHLAKEAIEGNCHVLVEKPFTPNKEDALELYRLAGKKGVKLCAMHNHFYDPCMRRADDIVQSGRLGKVINVESYYGLNTLIPAFRGYPSPNTIPWLYELPGGVYQDFLPHPLYVMLDYTGRPEEIKVMSRSNGVLPQGLPDEIRILIKGERAFGTLAFSFAARPHLQFLRIYGTKMMAEVDFNTMTAITHPESSLPKAAQKASFNLSAGWQLLTNTVSNVKNFMTGKLKPYQGMKILIHGFYDSIKNNAMPPVTQEQAVRVIETMDEIFRQLTFKPLSFEPVIPRRSAMKRPDKVLVTGGTGFLGRRLVSGLVKEGYPVRVLARKLSNIDDLKGLGAEIFFGDVADEESIDKALEGANIVIHAAAGTSGRKEDCDTATIEGTANVLRLAGTHRIKKMVYISSCSVYGVAGCKPGHVIDEDSSLEKSPSMRGYYSESKYNAEQMVTREAGKNFPVVILRPGTIYGPGGEVFSPMLGFSLMKKAFVIIGNGKFNLPLIHVDNLIDDIIASMQNSMMDNRIFNVVDDERVSKREYMDKLIRLMYPKSRVFYLPLGILSLMVSGQEVLCRLMKRKPFLTRYRLVSSQTDIRFDNSRLKRVLNRNQKTTFESAIPLILEHERNR